MEHPEFYTLNLKDLNISENLDTTFLGTPKLEGGLALLFLEHQSSLSFYTPQPATGTFIRTWCKTLNLYMTHDP